MTQTKPMTKTRRVIIYLVGKRKEPTPAQRRRIRKKENLYMKNLFKS